MANVPRRQDDRHVGAVPCDLAAKVDFQALPQHCRLAAGKEAVVTQGLRIPADAAVLWCKIYQGAGGRHVASLALLPLLARRTCQPFGIGAVNVHAEDGPFMTGSAVAAIAIYRGICVCAAIYIVEGTKG